MPRKSGPSRAKPRVRRGINPATGLPWRFRVPREMRVVTASRVGTKTQCAGEQVVPQIRLRGAWLARLGFRRGVRFIVLADSPRQIVLAAMP